MNRAAHRAVEATTVDRARSLAVEQAIGVGLIVAIGAIVLPMVGGSTPARSRAAEVWGESDGTRGGPTDRQDRHTRERAGGTATDLPQEDRAVGR